LAIEDNLRFELFYSWTASVLQCRYL